MTQWFGKVLMLLMLAWPVVATSATNGADATVTDNNDTSAQTGLVLKMQAVDRELDFPGIYSYQ